MKNKNTSELIINYLQLKQDLEDLKENANKKVYLIHKKDLNEFLEICKRYESISINDLKKELPNKNIDININNKNIKLISDISEIEDTELELVDKEFISYLNYNEEYLKDKELILIKRPENIKEIIFRHNKILKIRNKSILQFTESPLELVYSISDKKLSRKIDNNNIKNEELNHIQKKSDSHLKNNENYTIFKRYSKKNIENINSNNIKANTSKINEKEIFKFYRNLYQILNKQKQITKFIKDSLNYTNHIYLTLSKKNFHKLIKIFESNQIYENDSCVLQFSQIIKINNELEERKLKEINERYEKRILGLKEEKSFPVDFVQIDEYNYPKDFIIIEDFYLDFLSDDIRNKYKYEMILGNNLLFIKDNKDNKIVYIYSADKDKYSIEAIFIFEQETNLKNEIETEFKKVKNISEYYNNKNLNLSIINDRQRVFDIYEHFIGDIIIIQNQNNIIDENNVIDKNNNNNDPEKNNNSIHDKNKKIDEENNNKIEVKYADDPQLLFHKYVEALLICLFNIENLRTNFPNKNNDINSIANIIYNFMKNKEINMDDINKIENKIKEFNINISELNFEKLLNFILDKLHEELNNKKIISQEKPKDDNDEKISYDNFQKYYFEQNDSIIQKIFFGVKEINILYNCCQLTKYSFEICKYLSFENANQKKDIQSLIDEWENSSIKDNKYCDMCLIDTDTIIQKKMYDYPEILIIIINNNKNIVKIDLKIKLNKRNEYQLINFISEAKNESSNFNIIYKENNDLKIYQNNNMNKNNIVNDLNSYIPYAIFYGKIKRSMTDKKSNLSYVTDVFGSSFQSENKNDFLLNFNNQNNQNNMLSSNNNNFYNFNQNNFNLYQN